MSFRLAIAPGSDYIGRRFAFRALPGHNRCAITVLAPVVRLATGSPA